MLECIKTLAIVSTQFVIHVAYVVVAKRLSARQLILLRISLCICMCMYVCLSRLGMLIFCTCTWCVLEVWRAHTAAPLLSVGLSACARVFKYDGSICHDG